MPARSIETGTGVPQTMDKTTRMDGSGLIIYAKLPEFQLCKTAVVPAAGRYRVRMTACAVGTEGKPLSVGLLTAEETGHYEPVLREVRDIPAGNPTAIEFDFDLAAAGVCREPAHAMGPARSCQKPLAEYTGPGLRVEWIERRGSDRRCLSAGSYDTLFAGVPLKARSVAKAESEGAKPPTINEKRPIGAWWPIRSSPCRPIRSKDAERLIRDFLPRAFRRPVSEEVQQHFVQAVLAKLDQKYTFFDAMTYGYKLILSSPNFLFLMDSPAAAANRRGICATPKLDDYSLAERLSYFLWSAPPDRGTAGRRRARVT